MDRNAFLAFALSFLVLSLWMTWEAKHHPVPPPAAAPVAEKPSGEAPTSGPAEAGPAVQPSPPPPAAAAPSPAPPLPAPRATGPAEAVEVSNSLFHAVLTSEGAGIRSFELLQYTAPRSEGGGPVLLIQREPDEAPAFSTPLTSLGLGDLSRAPFRVTERKRDTVAFEYTQSGVTIRKAFAFADDSYLFRLRFTVRNDGSRPVSPAFTVVLPERVQPGSDFRELTLATLAEGSVTQTPIKSFGRAGFFGGTPKLEREFTGDVVWAGGFSHYFLMALVPDVSRDARTQWKVEQPGEETIVSVSHPPVAVPPGTEVEREYSIYAGPKEPARLLAAGSQLDRSINLGWKWVAPLTRAFIYMLKALHTVIPNYGIAIIILTVAVRLLTAPLAAKQMKSMKRMGELQPKIKQLQEKHKDDRQAQSQEMMKLYKEAGVNPLGGCLPMVLQIPVFIGLYYALQSSIELRQAPFFLWIDDLSRPETLFTLPGTGWPVRLLPILMTGSMVLQQRMTPTTSMDPTQQRTMMFVMPLMFFFMFYGFPSGLVLYWLVSNLLAVAQQMYLNRRMSPRTG